MTDNNVFLGVGSNLNKIQNINSCINYFRASFSFCNVSPVYQSPSFGFKGNDFLNLVININTNFSLLCLKTWLMKVEDLHGRDRQQTRYSNRTLDIDILLFNSDIYKDPKIIIPRPEILTRAYVLKPLADISNNLTHPQTSKSFQAHWQEFNGVVKLQVIDLELLPASGFD